MRRSSRKMGWARGRSRVDTVGVREKKSQRGKRQSGGKVAKRCR